MKKLRKQLFKLLRTHTPSGREWQIIPFLIDTLRSITDRVWLDEYGNILAEKKYGSSGYTVLLSAHMDTVADVQPIPVWRKRKTEIHTLSSSALGGDDKCGIAAHLAILREMNRQTDFTGTVKVCFSREEESGCVGAGRAVRLNPSFFEDVNAAIVIDRKGGSDVVTGSCWERYCAQSYGEFWIEMGRQLDPDFAPVEATGTVSDAMVFAERGINSVNLSAGYYSAHTSREYIKIAEVERVVRWVTLAMNHIETKTFPSFEPYATSSMFDADMIWRTYNKDYSTIAYCDLCGVDEYVCYMEKNSNDMYVCPDCLLTCVYCEVVQLPENMAVYRGYDVCQRCLEELVSLS